MVLPLLACAAAVLMLQGPEARRRALHWALLVLATLILVAASKIAFYGWGTGVRRWNLTCFSGHAVLAWLTWPCLLMLTVPMRHPKARILACVAGAAIAMVVAWSRVELGAHPVSEVVAGSVLGLAATLVAVRMLRPLALGRGAFVVGLPVLVLALWLGQAGSVRVPSERWFAKAGMWLSGNETAVDRGAWRRRSH
nr:phosphatase PAP2 family protein [Luteimonas sp. BDR2-5]